MKAKDIYIQGYGYLSTILAHYNAVPILIDICKKHNVPLYEWDKHRTNTDRFDNISIEIKFDNISIKINNDTVKE